MKAEVRVLTLLEVLRGVAPHLEKYSKRCPMRADELRDVKSWLGRIRAELNGTDQYEGTGPLGGAEPEDDIYG